MGKTFNASVDWLGMVENPDQDVNPSVNGEKAQIGNEIKPYVAVQDNTYVDIPPPPPAPTKVIDPFPHGTISQAPPEKAWYKKLLNVVAHPMEAFGRSIHNQDWWTGDLGQGLPMSPQHSTNTLDGFDMVNTFFNPASWVEDISDSESITEGVVNTAMLIPIVRGGKIVGYTNKANKSKPIFHKGSSYIDDPNSLYRVVNVPPGGTSVDELVKAAEYGTTIPKVTTSGRRAGYSQIQRETPFDVLNTTSDQGWILGKGTNDPYNLMNLYGGKNPYVIKMGRGNPLVGPESLKTINQRTDILRDFSFPYTQNVGKWNPATGQFDLPIELGAGVFTTVGKSADDLAKIMPGSIVNPNMLSRGNNNITTIFGPKGFQVRQPQEVLPMDEYIKYMKNNPNFKFQEGGPKSEREKYIQFALDTESGYHYIRNKDSAVKKLGADGKWDGKTYYKIYEDGKYYPHYVGDEKRATIGHGHAPVDRDIFEEYKEGIDETQALELLGKDIDEKLRLSEIYYNSRFGDGKWNDLTESEQFMLNDYTFNVRGGFHKTFRNFAQAIHDKDHKLAKKEYKRALGERNEIFMERYLKPWMDIQIERTTVAPPLEDMPLPIGTFPTDSDGNPQSMSSKPNQSKPKETSWWRGEEGWIPDELELPWFMDGAGINARGNTPSSMTDIPATADGSRAENATMSRSAMDPMPNLNNDLTINDNLALDNTIADLSEETNIPQVKYGGSLPKAQYGWNDFEESKIGKFVDAKGLRRDGEYMMNTIGDYFGYENTAEDARRMGLDASAMLNPIPDFINAADHYDQGKYTDAALYAGFGILPFSAGPLVRGTKDTFNYLKNINPFGKNSKLAKELSETLDTTPELISNNTVSNVNEKIIQFEKANTEKLHKISNKDIQEALDNQAFINQAKILNSPGKLPLTRVLDSKGLTIKDNKLFSKTGDQFFNPSFTNSRNTTHWSYGHIGDPGHGGGAWSNKSTAIISDFENLKGSGHVMDLDPTDTYFYSKGDFEIPSNSLILTRDKKLYNKIKKETNITNIKLFENTSNDEFQTIVNSFGTKGPGKYNYQGDLFNEYIHKNWEQGIDVAQYKPARYFDESGRMRDSFGGGSSKMHHFDPTSYIEGVGGLGYSKKHGLFSEINKWPDSRDYGKGIGTLDAMLEFPKPMQIFEMDKLLRLYKNKPEARKIQKKLAEMNGFKSYKEFKESVDMTNFKKYGGQHMWGLDLRSTKAQAGKEVKSDDIYANDRYSQSAAKYKKMLPKYQSQGQLPKAQFGRHSIMSGNAHGLRPEGSTGVLGDFYDKSGISDGKYKWLLGDTKTGGAAGAFVSNLLDIANIPSNLMAEATEYFGERGDKEFNFLDAMPGFSGDFSFTNMYGEPTKTVSGTVDDQGNPLVDNFWGGLATDIFTDPTSYVGIGLVTKGSKLPSVLGKTSRNVKQGLDNAATNIDNAMGGTKMTSKGLQIWDGEDWVLSNKQQALNTIKKIIEQKKILQNQAANKVKGAQQKLYNLEKNKAKLISDFEKIGFDTKELHDEAYLDVFAKYVKMGRGEKYQQNIVDDMTIEFWELSDFLDNAGGDKFDDLLDAINKGAKLDDELIKKHLSKSAYERFKNIKNTLKPNRQYYEGKIK